MEKQQLKLKNKILKILPKAAAAIAVTFQNHPFSPASSRAHKSRPEKATKWLIPLCASNDVVDLQEPTSPKVSCMGQITHKKEQIKKVKPKRSVSLRKGSRNVNVASSSSDREIKTNASTFQFQRMLFHGAKPGRKSDASNSKVDQINNKEALIDRVSHLNQMMRFSSGRDAFTNFDWKDDQEAPKEIDYHSDEDRAVESDVEKEEALIPFSAPILVGDVGGVLNLKPRKEINIWKRRTMAPPRPLQLNPLVLRANWSFFTD